MAPRIPGLGVPAFPVAVLHGTEIGNRGRRDCQLPEICKAGDALHGIAPIKGREPLDGFAKRARFRLDRAAALAEGDPVKIRRAGPRRPRHDRIGGGPDMAPGAWQVERAKRTDATGQIADQGPQCCDGRLRVLNP